MSRRREAVVRIEPEGLRYALIEGLGRRVVREGLWTLPAEQEGGSSESPAGLPERLVESLRKAGVGRVRLELPLGRAVIHLLDLPPMKRRDVGRAVPFELERRMPIPLDHFFWAHRVLRADADGVRVMTAAVRRNLLSPYLDALKEAGIEARSIEFTLLRRLASASAKEAALYVEKSGSAFDMVLASGGGIVLARTFEAPFAPEQALAAFAAEARRELKTHGCARLVLCGEEAAADAGALRELLPEEIRIETETASGLTPAASPKRHRLDILPDAYRFRRDYHNVALAVLAVLLLLVFLAPGLLRDLRDRQALERINHEVEELGGRAEAASGTLREQERLFRAVRTLRPYFNDRLRPFAALEELSRIVPENTWLVNFAMDEKGKIEIDGFSSASAELVGLLEDSPFFAEVELAGPVIMQEPGEHFAIRMYWEGGP